MNQTVIHGSVKTTTGLFFPLCPFLQLKKENKKKKKKILWQSISAALFPQHLEHPKHLIDVNAFGIKPRPCYTCCLFYWLLDDLFHFSKGGSESTWFYTGFSLFVEVVTSRQTTLFLYIFTFSFSCDWGTISTLFFLYQLFP